MGGLVDLVVTSPWLTICRPGSAAPGGHQWLLWHVCMCQATDSLRWWRLELPTCRCYRSRAECLCCWNRPVDSMNPLGDAAEFHDMELCGMMLVVSDSSAVCQWLLTAMCCQLERGLGYVGGRGMGLGTAAQWEAQPPVVAQWATVALRIRPLPQPTTSSLVVEICC
jgi:hypothetical protein